MIKIAITIVEKFQKVQGLRTKPVDVGAILPAHNSKPSIRLA